jgi:LacI family transcriptional regulator
MRREGRRIGGIPAGGSVSEQPTIIDVAQRARVSITTVSHVLNENPAARVSPGTRARVREAAGALGYAANAMARGLVRQKTHHLGAFTPSRSMTAGECASPSSTSPAWGTAASPS